MRRPLLFHRKKNLFGSFFGDYAGWSRPVVSAGYFNMSPPAPLPDYTLSLNGTNYMTLSETIDLSGNDFEITAKINTTSPDLQFIVDGDVDLFVNARINTGVVEFLSGDGVGGWIVNFSGTIPINDGIDHIIKWRKEATNYTITVDGVLDTSLINSVPTITKAAFIGQRNTSVGRFIGTIYSVDITDLTTPANNIKWNIDSGLVKYSVGDEKHIAPNDFSNPVWTDFNSTHTADGTVTVTAAYGRMRQLVSVVAGELFELTLDVKGISDYATLRFYAVGAGLNFSELTPPITTEWQSLRWLVSIPTESDATDFECGVNQELGLPVYQVRNFSLKPYIDTISDGTIYQDSETYGTLSDIMRADDWGTIDPDIIGSGRTAIFSGSQTTYASANANQDETYSGLHALTFKVFGETQGKVKVALDNNPQPANVGSGVYTIYQNPTTASPGRIRITEDGADAARFDGSVEIISVKPVPEGLIMQGVVDADWIKQGTVTNNGIAITHNGETVTNG